MRSTHGRTIASAAGAFSSTSLPPLRAAPLPSSVEASSSPVGFTQRLPPLFIGFGFHIAAAVTAPEGGECALVPDGGVADASQRQDESWELPGGSTPRVHTVVRNSLSVRPPLLETGLERAVREEHMQGTRTHCQGGQRV